MIMHGIIIHFLLLGAGIRHASGASGASHGGRGGKSNYVYSLNMPYCHIYDQCYWGSGGGGTSSTGLGGRGGGYIHIDVQQIFEMEGTMYANANNAVVSMVLLSSEW